MNKSSSFLVLCECTPELVRKTIKLDFIYVRFEVFMAVSMKNDVFWDVMPCGSCEKRCFGGT
jgi:hypothetical protein